MPETDFLEQKWRTIFKRFDLDQDELITFRDIGILKVNLVRVYNLRDPGEYATVSNQIDKFMDCILFRALLSSGRISEAKFVRLFRDAYEADKMAFLKRIPTCHWLIESLYDRNTDGFLSFEEAVDAMKAWNQDNTELQHEIFQMMGPNENSLVPLEKVHDFFLELVSGENKETFTKIINAFKKAKLRVK